MSTVKADADAFLKEYKIIEILEEFGDPVITGSYDLDLMLKKELDINLLIEDYTPEQVLEILKKIALETNCVKINYRNRATPETTIRIYGHWINFQQIGNENWELDIWVLNRKENSKHTEVDEALKKRLTPENRKVIMELKEYMQNNPRDPMVFSYSIYEAVLDHGVRNVEGFLSYLHRLEME